ncbi:MAG: T9SS type A sorting domain-containing protein [Bacteroidota bacterium]
MFRKLSILSYLLFLSASLLSQDLVRADLEIRDLNNAVLRHGLTGGLNNPQFSQTDINLDGIQDLLVFDRTGDVLLPFLGTGNSGADAFEFAPQFIDQFPELIEWALFYDYNCDGQIDLFTYTKEPGIGGVDVYKGFRDGNNDLQFEKITFPIHTFDILNYIDPFTNNRSNIFVSSEDLPSFVDLDSDSDMDILTFSIGGGYIEYFENKSADLGYGCDSLIFELVDECWGRFFEGGVTEELNLSPKSDSCVFRDDFLGKSGGVHVGSTLLNIDMDADGDYEIILGDISFTNLNLSMNNLNSDTAWMDQQFINFPQNAPVNITSFPAAFYVDIDHDGVKDLVVSPNAENISENKAVAWAYLNAGANNNPNFGFSQTDFLVEDMIDLGTESNPVFFDHNGDGLEDMVVGTFGFFLGGGNFDARLFLWENIGTATSPKYQLVDDNYGGMMGLGLNGLAPAFGDLDNDNDLDMLVGAQNGKLYYLENEDIGDGLAVFNTVQPNYQDIDVGLFSTPFIVDITRNNTLDLIIGERQGNLNYFENTGTLTNPVFTEVNSFFGEVDVREPGFPTGYSQPVVVDNNGNYEIYSGSEPGNLKYYTDVESNLISGAFVEADLAFGGVKEGNRTRLSIADINDDNTPDYVVGNLRGGLAVYSETPIITTSTEAPIRLTGDLLIFPNPTSDQVQVVYDLPLPGDAQLRLFDVLGRQLQQIEFAGEYQLDLSPYPNGVYVIVLQVDGQDIPQKIIKR